MPQQTEPERPSSLPSPEVNPLMNPVLAQNMGRWAEVYFKTPPEHREQAVLDLVRELQEKQARNEEDVAPNSSAEGSAVETHVSAAPQLGENEGMLVLCPSCGEPNPPDQRFCGMCGVPLPSYPVTVDPQMQDDSRRELRTEHPESVESNFDPREASATEPETTRAEPGSIETKHHGDSNHDDLRLLPQPMRSPNRSRVLIGAVLAVLIVALAYVARRGEQARPKLSQANPPVSAAETSSPPTRAPIPSNATSSPTNVEPNGSAAGSSTQPPLKRPALKPAPQKHVKFARPKAPPAEPIKPVAAAGNGSEEFATAQNYLTGGAGQRRNPAAAVEWLWKSIAKQNTDATMLLSDLYLRGEGVQKNCDQARVLLDAAARKGRKDASARLRNLQTFGCE